MMLAAPAHSGLPVGLTSINLTTALRNRYYHFPCLPRSQEELRAVTGPAPASESGGVIRTQGSLQG